MSTFKLLDHLVHCQQPATPSKVWQRIQSLIHHAYDLVPFYKDLFDQNRIRPHDMRNLRDYLEHFPRTSASEYRSIIHERGIQYVLAQSFPPEGLRRYTTSGSSGPRLTIHKTTAEITHNAARTLWYLTRAGLRPWHSLATFDDPPPRPGRDSALQQLGIFRRSFADDGQSVDELLELMERKRINAFHGKKSSIIALADHYISLGRRPPALRILMPSGEVLTRGDQAVLSEAFRPHSFSEMYGTTEVGMIATRACAPDARWEVDYNAVFFCLDNPTPYGPYRQGKIVATSQILRAQPLLMIGLGDRITVAEYDRLSELGADLLRIEGRENDHIILMGGERLSAATLLNALDRPALIRQFQVIQDQPAQCRILVRPTRPSTERRQAIQNLVAEIFNGRIEHTVEWVDRIPREKSGKTKLVISNTGVRRS